MQKNNGEYSDYYSILLLFKYREKIIFIIRYISEKFRLNKYGLTSWQKKKNLIEYYEKNINHFLSIYEKKKFFIDNWLTKKN